MKGKFLCVVLVIIFDLFECLLYVRTLCDCSLSDYCTVFSFINIIVIISSIMIMNGFQPDTRRWSISGLWGAVVSDVGPSLYHHRKWSLTGWHYGMSWAITINQKHGIYTLLCFQNRRKTQCKHPHPKCPCRRYDLKIINCKGMWLVVGRCLYIPCAFVTHFGKCIDEKTPLLRSMDAATRRIDKKRLRCW